MTGVSEEVRPLRMLHTSDVHLGAYTSQPWKTEADGAETLEPALKAFKHVLALGVEADVDVVAIAGDFFDHVRVKRPYVEVTGELMESVGRPVVILPGNHDPHMAEGIYQKFADAFPSNVHVIASAEGELVLLDEVGVQFWGQAHESYNDFSPASARPAWSRTTASATSGVSRWRTATTWGPASRVTRTKFRRRRLPHWTPTMSRWATSTCTRASATARCRRTIPARRDTRAGRRLWTLMQAA